MPSPFETLSRCGVRPRMTAIASRMALLSSTSQLAKSLLRPGQPALTLRAPRPLFPSIGSLLWSHVT